MDTNEQFNTPILMIVFKRPETTRKVFAEIRKIKPRFLYVVANGPREGHPEDSQRCEEVRKIVRDIDWPCEFKPLFKDDNKGPKDAFLSAINWFFQQVDEGIILEDDCLPHPTFFPYCRELLSRYRNDARVMHISGNNFQFGRKRGDASYYFSRYSSSWGWATWKRAWQCTDAALKDFPLFEKKGYIKNILPTKAEQRVWSNIFRYNYYENDSADALWTYAIWSQNGLCIIPNVNLVSNIGFGKDAVHTTSTKFDGYLANMSTANILPLSHPLFVMQDTEADNFLFRLVYYRNIPQRVVRRLRILWYKFMGE